METKRQTIFVLAILFFLFIVSYLFWPTLKAEFKETEVILVKIKLLNKCSFKDEVFIVIHQETGRTVSFSNGIANIHVPEGSNLRLALSPAYPNFRYDGIPQPAEKNMTLIADCSTSPRMQMIMDSMNKSFSN